MYVIVHVHVAYSDLLDQLWAKNIIFRRQISDLDKILVSMKGR